MTWRCQTPARDVASPVQNKNCSRMCAASIPSLPVVEDLAPSAKRSYYRHLGEWRMSRQRGDECGSFIAAAVPPNPDYYRGEGRLDDLVWPEGLLSGGSVWLLPRQRAG